MAVPARPVSGEPVASGWGQVAHDSIVAQDIQAGSGALVTTSGGGTLTVTFPRPFASPPVIFLNLANFGGPTGLKMIRADNATTTTFQVSVFTTDAATAIAAGVTIPFHWLAYGPRA